MRALGADPTPFLPGHVGIVKGLATAGKMQALRPQLFHRGGNVVSAEAQVMNMLANLVESIAERCTWCRLDELDLG